MKEETNPRFDLEDRLLEFATEILSLCDALPSTMAGRHIAGQLLRSGTAPLSHHGEAQAAESAADFRHKMKIALKELKESWRWLRLVQNAKLINNPQKLTSMLKEIDELIRIFAASIKTSIARSLKNPPPNS